MRVFIGSVFLFFITVTAFGQTLTRYYLPDTGSISNPERGFYHEYLSDSKNPTPLKTVDFKKLKAENITLIRRLYSLTTFRDKPISVSFLDHIRQDMNAVRQSGAKVILRFAYTFNEPPPHDDARLPVVLQHIEQLAPLLQQNADVIAYMEAGFIGRWGEWHTSSNKLDNPQTMKTILFKLLEALPKSRAVAIRYSTIKKEIFLDEEPLRDKEAFTGTNRSRTAHHNDCFLAGLEDKGTYWPNDSLALEKQKSYLAEENKYLPQGGETCELVVPRCNCSTSETELRRMRWSTLNKGFEENVLNLWRREGCFARIEKHLGYRFILVSATFPVKIKRGNFLTGSFIIKNQGYASPYNQREVELVLRRKSAQKQVVKRLKIDVDPRRWLPDSGNIKVDVKALIPRNLPKGKYEVFLNLPDPKPTLNPVAQYSIRLANKNIWHAQTGYNSLNFTITVD